MTALDKATYLAQVLAPFSLLITVVFAWLGWHEARGARDDQMQYFIAQNSPDVVVKDVSIVPHPETDGGLLRVSLSNIGGSNSKNICITIMRAGGSKKEDEYRNTCDGEDIFGHLSLKKGANFELDLLKSEALADGLGFIPKAVSLYESEDDPQFKLANVSVLLAIHYQGFFEDNYVQLYSISFSPEPMPNKANSADAKSRAAD